jgi:transposase
MCKHVFVSLDYRGPRRRIVHPAPTCCPYCGGTKLSKIGEDVTKTLDASAAVVRNRALRPLNTARAAGGQQVGAG